MECSCPCIPVIYRFSKQIEDPQPVGAAELGESLCPSCGCTCKQKYVRVRPLSTLYFFIPISTGKEILKTACSACNTVLDSNKFSKCGACGIYTSNACRFCSKCGHSK